ncbi:MAG: undecaprenyldiphospho-muramoylpentapeptide beta-N-acetylglucosaminyltransferase [Vicinamibacterales bacterium]|nr:undecaprenyldiphospho-muramoylpentapeptide beta-N-acetylglucosaminyltransferase [Vicinamibacterales bacterium]
MADQRSTRVLMSGAGTGGHLYPGIAVAQEIRRRHPGSEVVFAGTGRDLEVRALERLGFDLVRVHSAGLKGKSAGALVQGLSILPLSAWDAWRVITRVAPQVVIGLGGYSSGAVVLIAALRRIPTLVLEQNAQPGITNRLLASVVTAAAVSHDVALPHFYGKGFVSGNPVRAAFFEPAPQATAKRAEVHLLVLGGSQGAHAINVAMMAAAPLLVGGSVPVVVTHQTGDRDHGAVRRVYAEAGLPARVEPFLDDMVDAMRDADVVLCRAGATTLAEIAAVGRVALLVPLPGAADAHQWLNADVLVRAGAADVVPQAGMTGAMLAERLLQLAGDGERRRRMATAARALARPDAAGVIVDRAEQLMRW